MPGGLSRELAPKSYVISRLCTIAYHSIHYFVYKAVSDAVAIVVNASYSTIENHEDEEEFKNALLNALASESDLEESNFHIELSEGMYKRKSN